MIGAVVKRSREAGAVPKPAKSRGNTLINLIVLTLKPFRGGDCRATSRNAYIAPVDAMSISLDANHPEVAEEIYCHASARENFKNPITRQ